MVIPLRTAASMIAQAGVDFDDCTPVEQPVPEPQVRMEIVIRWSGWRKGGYNQQAWCSDLRREFEASLGRSVEWTVLATDERTKEEFPRRFFYQYFCRAEAKWTE